MTQLQEGHLYAISSGVFQAYRKPDSDKWELWTWQGLSGYVIGRTGFEVDVDGNLYDRVMDFETGKPVVMEKPSYQVSDLEEVPTKALTLLYVKTKDNHTLDPKYQSGYLS